MTVLLQALDLGAIRGENVLFSHLELQLHQGEIVRLCGPNGCGKTTLIKILAGLREADAGEVIWKDKRIAQVRAEWHEAMLFVGHKSGISPELTPLENLRHWCDLRNRAGHSRIESVLAELGLAKQVSLPVASLSAGQKQRVSLARLLLCPADIWFLDEPLTALDVDGQQWLEQQLQLHTSNGGSVILTTHQAFATDNPALRSLFIQSPQNEASHMQVEHD